MPAPKISKSSVRNALSALKEEGHVVASMSITPDGVILLLQMAAEKPAQAKRRGAPPTWDEAA